MDIKRRLDYIFSSNCFFVKESGPCNILNLGSDHRVVRSVLVGQKRRAKTHVKQVQMKNWCPDIDRDGKASKYQQKLEEELDYTEVPNVESINAALYEAATFADIRSQVSGEGKPWQSEAIQSLIRKRRLSITSEERAEISKQIQKVSRNILRKHQNEEATNMLQQISGLSDLPKHQEYPITKSGNSTEIDCNIFAEASRGIYEGSENIPLVNCFL